MKRQSLHNHRWVAWLVSVAFVLMAVGSRASWQCLDGHPCPPGCAMQHVGEGGVSSAPRACCLAQRDQTHPTAGYCELCAGAKPSHAQLKERCTYPVCVKHINAKPQINTPNHAHFVFDFDTTAVVLPAASPVLLTEETGTVTFGSPRAPPDRVVVRLHSPRAPPEHLA